MSSSATRGCILAACVLVAASSAHAQQELPLAVTIDDLPFVGRLPNGVTRQEAIARILAHARGVPIAGFVTCGNIASDERDLRQWIEGGITVGNHSTSHRSIDDLGLDAWRADLIACGERLTGAMGRRVRYYRYPFLRTGRDPALRDAARDALRELGLTNAPVTIDTSEWALVRPYVEAIERGDTARADEIGRAYVQHLRHAARRYRELARERGHERTPQILLLHANALAADHLGAVLDALRADGFRFVGLEEALAHPLYARDDRYVGPIGMSWLHRIADDGARGWAWDAAQLHAMEVRFAGRPERARFDLDDELSIRRVARDAWVVTHAVPLAANSMIVRMDDGTLLMAHTPWDEAHTRRLVEYLRARFGDAPIVAIAAHFHPDAVAGAGALIEAGARWIGSEHTARLMRERSAATGAELRRIFAERPAVAARFDGYSPPVPRETFAEREGLILRFGRDEVRVLHPGHGHAPDNVVIHVPSRRLLFGGCAVVGMPRLGYLHDADLASWPAAIRRMQALRPAVVVPGHGERTDPGLLRHTLRLIRDHQRSGTRP